MLVLNGPWRHAGAMGNAACLASAVAFGLMAVFAVLAYDEGVGVDALLLVRFVLAGAVLLAVAALAGRLRDLGPRVVVAGLAMGALGYAAQAGLYLFALTRVDASQVALLFSGYPLLVTAGAVLTRRERPTVRRGVALVLALAGVALVLGGSPAGGVDPLGAACAIGAAVVYTGYILVGDRVAGGDPLAFAALVCCGAAGTFAVRAAVAGVPDLGFEPRGWLWLALIALVSTVAAIVLFFAGLARVGPGAAALLSVVEPVVTVGSAALVFGEVLTVPQLVGGSLVLATVLLVRLPQDGDRGAQPADGGPGTDRDAVRVPV
ncbi:DMT family transporter [Angustibacter speluncae]